MKNNCAGSGGIGICVDELSTTLGEMPFCELMVSQNPRGASCLVENHSRVLVLGRGT